MYSAEDFCNYLGVDYETKGGITRIVCPFHNDNHPSMVVYPELERGAYCFACGEGASWAWLASHIKGIPYPEALKDLGQESLPPSATKNTIKPPTALSFCDEPNKRFVEAFEQKMGACIPLNLDPADLAQKWLKKKGLWDVAWELGWKWHNGENFKYWRMGIVIPYHINGKVAYVRYRALEPGGAFNKPKGPMDVGIQPYYDTFRPCDTVFIVEGESDAASVYAHNCSAIGIPGALSRKAINSAVAFIADHKFINRVVLCGDDDDAGRKMNALCREAMMTMGVRAEILTYSVESEGEKADLNDDHVNGLFKPPVQWTCHYKDNYDRCFGKTEFSEYVDRVDTYLKKCDEKGIDPWKKYGNVYVLPAANKTAEPEPVKSEPEPEPDGLELVVTRVGEPQKSKYGGTFRYIFFKDVKTGDSLRTCIDEKCRNRVHWDEVISLYEQKADFHLVNVGLKSTGLVDADSMPRVVPKNN